MIEGATSKNLNGGNLIVYYAPAGSPPELLRIKEENRQQIEKLQEQLISMEKERTRRMGRSTALAREESTGNS